MSQISYESLSPVECREGELYKLTFGEDEGVLDSYRYFSQDVGSQTEEKDVIEIIEMSEALKILTIENVDLKRTLSLTRSSLQSDFYRRLTTASNQLYSRMNQRLDDVEQSQRDRVEVVRRAFRTQLSDALSQMSALYDEKIKKKLNNDRTFIESEESVKYTKKISDLITKLRKYEIKIKELEKRIKDLEESEIEPQPTMILDSESERSEKALDEDKISLVESEVEEITQEEDLKQREYIEELIKRIETLEKQNNTYQKDIRNLDKEIETLTSEIFSSKGILEVLKSEKQVIENTLNKSEEEYSRRLLDLEMKLAVDKDKTPIIQEVETKEKPFTISVNIQKNYKEFPDMSKEVASLKKLVKETTEKELELSNEIIKIKNKSGQDNNGYIEEIKILQSINEKLRNEMFTRHQLQNDFKTLHSASVKYAKNNHPIGILPSQSIEKDALSRHSNYTILPTLKSNPKMSDIDTSLLSNFVEMNIN